MRAGKMGQPDNLKISTSNSCEAADPSTQMRGCQIQLLTTETELVPWLGRFLDESISSRADPYSRGMALIDPCMLTSITVSRPVDTAQMFPEGFPVLEGIWVWQQPSNQTQGQMSPLWE